MTKDILKDLYYYEILQRKLIPLKRKEKTPLHKYWSSLKYDYSSIRDYIIEGYNIGWVLGSTDCVIIVNPKYKNAEKSESRIKQKWKLLDAHDNFEPHVITGSDTRNRQYYISLPDNTRLPFCLPNYPDIFFRTYLHYVLVPGSVHPKTQLKYTWNTSKREPAKASRAFIKHILTQ